jgi:predicted ArsR family transcriptional regulator
MSPESVKAWLAVLERDDAEQVLESTAGLEERIALHVEEDVASEGLGRSAGRVWGAHLVHKPPPFTSTSREETIDEVVRLHEEYGFRPKLRRVKGGRELVLKRCPFQEVATAYQAVVCPLHLGLMRGALAELGPGVEADWLEPFAEPGACVGHLTGA